jgi:hypothetical protein
MTADTLKLVHLAYFHSVLTYGLILWENSRDRNIIRIMACVKSTESFENYFRNLLNCHLQMNTRSTYYHLWWKTWNIFKEIQI